jgi:hypothetical protein
MSLINRQHFHKELFHLCSPRSTIATLKYLAQRKQANASSIFANVQVYKTCLPLLILHVYFQGYFWNARRTPDHDTLLCSSWDIE